MNINRDENTIRSYVAICQTFLEGVVRLVDSQVAFMTVMNGFTGYRERIAKTEPEDGPYADILRPFEEVSLKQFWSAQYVHTISNLIYAASLFDTFLNESTIFLLLLIPEAIGKAYQVPIRSLIDGQSRSSILTEVAKQKARDISFKSFKERLGVLRDTFGIPIALTDDTIAALEHFSNLRNSAVHDQGFFALSLEEAGSIKHDLRTSPTFPSNIIPEDSDKAEKMFRFVALTVANDIFKGVLKADHGSLPSYLEAFMEKILTSPPPAL